MRDNFLSQVIGGNWHRTKVVVPPDTPFTLQSEDFYKPFTEDIVTLMLREYEYMNAGSGGDYEMLLSGAEEIERLRRIIKAYVKADREYQDDMKHLDAVPIREAWKEAWIDLAKEADRD